MLCDLKISLNLFLIYFKKHFHYLKRGLLYIVNEHLEWLRDNLRDF